MTQAQAMKKAQSELAANPAILGVTIRANAKGDSFRFMVASNGDMVFVGKGTL